MKSPEVVVIGAGPAGLAAAIALAQRGVGVVVAETGRVPVNKVCGEGLMPSALIDLARLGITPRSVFARGMPLAGVRYISPRGKVAEARFAEGQGAGLCRGVFSKLLLERAHRLPGVTLRFLVKSVRLQPRRPKGFVVQLDGEAVTPRIVIAADGLNSDVRRQAGLVQRYGRVQRWGLRRHFEIEPWTNCVEVYWSRGVEAYVTPVGVRQCNVALLCDKAAIGQGPASRVFDELLMRFPGLKQRLGDVRACDKPRAVGPLCRIVPEIATDGLVLVGDAAGYVDAITGEGVGLALRDALLLADSISPLLSSAQTASDPLTKPMLWPYVTERQRTHRANYALTWLLLRLRNRPAFLERCIGLLAASPALFQRALSLNMGRSLFRKAVKNRNTSSAMEAGASSVK